MAYDDKAEMAMSAPQVLAREEELAIIAYWTPQRMAEARPLPLPTPRGERLHPARASDQPIEQSAVAPDG